MPRTPRTPGSRRRVAGAVACAPAGLSCATAAPSGKGEKGGRGLVPVDVSPGTVADAHAPRRLALLVGIGTFDDPQWRKLRYPQKDASDLARVLADPRRGDFGEVV